MNYYNDNNSDSVAWMKQLILAGLIPQGDIDDRSIADVTGSDLKGYTQCHFFAGIGGWAEALRIADYPVTTEIWSGSCPCQPFSVAGRQKKEKDERHLWPELRRLIATCKPDIILGEQVASAAGRIWLATVRFDLENINYWSAYHENLQQMREAAQRGCLSQVVGEVIGRIERDVSGLSKGVRKRLVRPQQGKEKTSPTETAGQREGLQAGIRRVKSRQTPGNGSVSPIQTQKDCLRLNRSYARNRESHPKRDLRNEWNKVRLPHKGSEVEQPVTAPRDPISWLYLPQRQDHLFRNERSLGELGGRGAREYCEGLGGKEKINDERVIAEIFGGCIEASVKRVGYARIRPSLEELGYAVGGADLCAASVGENGEIGILCGGEIEWQQAVIGAPHIRQRLWWVADSGRERHERRGKPGVFSSATENTQRQDLDEGRRNNEIWEWERRRYATTDSGATCGICGTRHPEDADCESLQLGDATEREIWTLARESRSGVTRTIEDRGSGLSSGVGDADRQRRDDGQYALLRTKEGRRDGAQTLYEATRPRGAGDPRLAHNGSERRKRDANVERSTRQNTPIGHKEILDPQRSRADFWSGFDLIPCLDNKARRVESGTFPLVNGLPKGMVRGGYPGTPINAQATAEARMMRLKGYGNAIVPQVAATFIRAYMEAYNEVY